MRAGLVIYGSLETVSGGYRYDRQLVEQLRRAGDSVEVFSSPWRNYARHLTDNLAEAQYQRLRTAAIDVLLQDELNHPSLFSLNRRLRAQVSYPIVAIVHHLRCYEARPAWLNRFYRWIERQYLASVSGFICNSETTRRAVSDVLRRTELPRVVVAQPAGDRFQVPLSEQAILERAYEPGALRIVFVGNLIARKGLHVLLAALARLPAETWQLTVIGNPQVDSKYTRRIQDQLADQHLTHVQLAGAVTDNQLAEVLAASQVLVVPSDYEGFGIVYLEGMSFGLPAMATTSGAAGEIIVDGQQGYLVPPNEADLLAQRLAGLSQDRQRLAQMSLAAYQRFGAFADWETSMMRIRSALLEWIT